MTRFRLAAIFGAFAVTGACATDFSTADGGAPADAGGGGGSDAGTQTDARGDFATGDAGSPIDFCKSGAAVGFTACDGFDQSTTFDKQWTLDESMIGSIAIDNGDSKSAPNSVLAKVPTHSSAINPYHQAYLTTDMGSGSFEIEFDFKATLDLAGTDPNGNVTYACIFESYTDDKENAQVCFGKSYFGITIETYDDDGGAPGSAHVDVAKAPPLDAWHHLKIDWSFLPAGGSISMEMDGVKMGATTPARTVKLKGSTGLVYPEIGLDSNGSLGDATVRFDNVVFRRL